MRASIAVAATISALVSGTASATLISVDDSATGTGNNLLFNPCDDPGALTAPNSGVIGCLNGRQNTFILASSDEPLQIAGGGQARIEAVDGLFDNLTIDFADASIFFDLLVVDIHADEDGVVDFGDGFVRNVSANGNNFFTLHFDQGINAYSFAALDGAWEDVRQVRFGFAEPNEVSEPGALGLLGLGIAGLALGTRRRKIPA